MTTVRKLSVFNSVTLDGYFTGPGGDMSWAHAGSDDPEFQAFVAENARGGSVLLFGRVTYLLMASYWPTPMASKNDPVVAERMNALPKIVFSRTLTSASWSNTTLSKGDLVEAVRALKEAPGDDLVILGSGSIVAQLTEAGLIDEFQVLVTPVVLGSGRTMFDGVREKRLLRLMGSRTFGNGKVFLRYEPAS